ncbi:hypothetical protein N3K66_005378 [Trichothecium roseum]|uniref:Uncharacterized protein n=1 Tax=Trichothecium roseum TaxID=47278 RepID=A0ACC0UZD4_9HYPO|nr:hypothetical protein N3K66_005378 [Trichothecium roseum]
MCALTLDWKLERKKLHGPVIKGQSTEYGVRNSDRQEEMSTDTRQYSGSTGSYITGWTVEQVFPHHSFRHQSMLNMTPPKSGCIVNNCLSYASILTRFMVHSYPYMPRISFPIHAYTMVVSATDIDDAVEKLDEDDVVQNLCTDDVVENWDISDADMPKPDATDHLICGVPMKYFPIMEDPYQAFSPRTYDKVWSIPGT